MCSISRKQFYFPVFVWLSSRSFSKKEKINSTVLLNSLRKCQRQYQKQKTWRHTIINFIKESHPRLTKCNERFLPHVKWWNLGMVANPIPANVLVTCHLHVRQNDTNMSTKLMTSASAYTRQLFRIDFDVITRWR